MTVVLGTTSTSTVASDTNATFCSLLDLSSICTSLAALRLIYTAVTCFPVGSTGFARTGCVLDGSRIQSLLTGLL